MMLSVSSAGEMVDSSKDVHPWDFGVALKGGQREVEAGHQS